MKKSKNKIIKYIFVTNYLIIHNIVLNHWIRNEHEKIQNQSFNKKSWKNPLKTKKESNHSK